MAANNKILALTVLPQHVVGCSSVFFFQRLNSEHDDKDGQKLKANNVLPAEWKTKVNVSALKSCERKRNSTNGFRETWQKSSESREMLTWHISGRVTHPIPERPVRLYQYKWHRCHILMSATPAESYEEGCWMVHVQRQQYVVFQTPLSAITLTLSELIHIQSTEQNSGKRLLSFLT